MANTLFFFWGLIPLTLGFGFIFRPKAVLKAHRAFEKRRGRLEKRLFRAHRATGLAFVLLGLVMFLSWFHPVWIYNLFVMARILVALFFPTAFQPDPSIIPTAGQTVWI